MCFLVGVARKTSCILGHRRVPQISGKFVTVLMLFGSQLEQSPECVGHPDKDHAFRNPHRAVNLLQGLGT